MNLHKKTQIGLLIFAFFVLVYFLSAKGKLEISDTDSSLKTAKTIIANHSLSAEGCQETDCHRSPKDGRYYSKHGLGLPFLFIPYMLLGKAIALFTNLPENQTINFLISFYNIFFGAGACVIMFYMTRFFGTSDRISLIMALLLGLATFCWRYSIWDFSESAQMFFLLLSVYCVLKNSLKSLILGAFSFCCLLLLKALFIIYIPVFLLYILIKNDSQNTLKHVSVFLSIVLLGFGFLLMLNYIRFGEIFEFGYGVEAGLFYLSGIWTHAKKLLYWLDKGIFIYNPLFILGILGYYRLLKTFRKEAIFFLFIIGINFLSTSMWYAWHGNWSWGPRFLVPSAPLWLLPCFFFFNKKGPVKIIFLSLIFISLLIQGISVLQGNLEYLTICNANNAEGLKKGMPSQIVGAIIILKHKVIEKNSIYSLSEFGINSDTKVDVSPSGYRGFDFWYLRLAKYFNKPLLKYLPVLFLPFVFMCFIRLFKITEP